MGAWADALSDGEAAEKAGKLRDALNQYVAALRAAPEGSASQRALREKIFSIARRIKPPPKVPDAAIEHEGRAAAAVRLARNSAGFRDAAAEYRKAIAVAPWVPAYYFNLGVVLDKSGDPAAAIGALDLYLLASPAAKDAHEVKAKVAGLRYEIEKGVRDRDDQQRKASDEQARRDAVRRQEELARQREEDKKRRDEELFAQLGGRWSRPCDPGPRARETPANPKEIRIRGTVMEWRTWGGISQDWDPWSGESGTYYVFESRSGLIVTSDSRVPSFRIVSENELEELNRDGTAWRMCSPWRRTN